MKTKAKPSSDLHIRWMIRRDMPEVLAIENGSSDLPWCEEDFIRCLRQRNAIGMVAERRERIVGFTVYELHKNRLHLLNFAVHPSHRREGIGLGIVNKLVGKLSHNRRNRLMIELRESNLDGQCFLRAMGFRAISVLRKYFEDTGEDGYLFQWRLEK